MRAEATATLLALTACERQRPSSEAEPVAVQWVAGGLGSCTSLVPTPRQTVLAACERGLVEVDLQAQVTPVHASMVDHVALHPDALWVKLPDRLLRGALPERGQPFDASQTLRLGSVDDILAVPGQPLVVATPGTLVQVSEEATAARWRKVPVPMHQLAAGPSGEIWAVSREAVYTVEQRQFRQVIGGLSEVAAVAALPTGGLVVASGRPAQLGVVSEGSYTPTEIRVEGLTDLAVLPSPPLRLAIATSDGSVGFLALP